MSPAPAPVAVTAAEVVAVGGGVLEVSCGEQHWWATLGAEALAHLARDGTSAPVVGDVVSVTWWPDGPVTVDRVLRRHDALAPVVPLHR